MSYQQQSMFTLPSFESSGARYGICAAHVSPLYDALAALSSELQWALSITCRQCCSAVVLTIALLRVLSLQMKEQEWRVVVKALFVLHKLAQDGAPAQAHNLQARHATN
jgi:hypothetical protein